MLVFFGGICQLPDPREWLPGRMRRFKLNCAAEIIRNKKSKSGDEAGTTHNSCRFTILADL
jgi:hypothetical protein